MVGFKRKIVSVATVTTLVSLYVFFEDRTWSIYVSISAAYTVLVLGLLWSDGKWRRYIHEGSRSSRDLIQGRAVNITKPFIRCADQYRNPLR